MSTVVNCKVKYIRPMGYCDLREWMDDEKNAYIGRAGVVFINKERFPKTKSDWANPYKVGTHGDKEEVLHMYEEYMRNRLEVEPELKERLKALRGKCLGCWCAPEKCHGDVLIRLLQEINQETPKTPAEVDVECND